MKESARLVYVALSSFFSGLLLALLVFLTLGEESLIQITPSISHAFRLASKPGPEMQISLCNRLSNRSSRYIDIADTWKSGDIHEQTLALEMLGIIVYRDISDGNHEIIIKNKANIELVLSQAAKKRSFENIRIMATDIYVLLEKSEINVKMR